MKVAIIGGRKFTNYNLLKVELDKCIDLSEVVSGGARGADSLGAKYAIERGINLVIFPPREADKKKFGYGQAAMIRNELIVMRADVVVAFPDPNSKGTWAAISSAERLGKPVKVVIEGKATKIY